MDWQVAKLHKRTQNSFVFFPSLTLAFPVREGREDVINIVNTKDHQERNIILTAQTKILVETGGQKRVGFHSNRLLKSTAGTRD